jgi:hypothetical protein
MIVLYAECRVQVPTDYRVRTRSAQTWIGSVWEVEAKGPEGSAVVVLLTRHPTDAPWAWRQKCEAAAAELERQIRHAHFVESMKPEWPRYDPEWCTHDLDQVVTWAEMQQLRDGHPVTCRGCGATIRPEEALCPPSR